MGKNHRQSPQGRYRVMVNKNAESNKLYPVYIEYSWNACPIRRMTKYRCKFADWNQKGNCGRGELRASYGSEYKRINNELRTMLDKMDNNLAEYARNHSGNMSSDIIKGILDGKPLARKDEGRDFIEFTNELCEAEYKRNVIGISRKKNFLSGMKMFGEFLLSTKRGTYKPESIYLGEITPELVDSYIDWRRTVKRNGDETINHALAPIIKACQYATDLELLDPKINTRIKKMRIIVKPRLDDEDETGDVRYLTKEQIEQVAEYYKTCPEPRRKEFIEMFLFAYHACGLRVIDVMTLQWQHINFDKRELKKIQVKTRNRHTIPLNDTAIGILQRWKERNRRKKYVFDLVDDTLNINDDESLYNARNNATQCINQSLTVVGDQLGFDIPLTMHKARHSFAVHALNQGTDMSKVSRFLGHQSTAVTEKIYARFLSSTLSDTMSALELGGHL